MAIVINTNIASNKLIRQLTDASNAYQDAVEKLSTGIKINSAADNPAGYAHVTAQDSTNERSQ